MTKKIILILVLILTIIIIGYFWFKKPIDINDFTKNTIGVEDPNYDCFTPKSNIVKRCDLFGGEITAKITNIGIGIFYTVGCYPKEETKDAGQPCKTNLTCEGNCLWLGGDIIPTNSTKTCSSFKKPYFVYKKNGKTSNLRLCDNN